jgi:hypothetical protein
MATCAFPHVVALPFAEPLAPIQLGFAAIESNESHSIRIFRQLVMDCALSTLEHREPPLLSNTHPLLAPQLAVIRRREAG